MPKFKDLTGRRFGRLVVLERAPNKYKTHTTWRCACDCGNVVEVAAGSLRTGLTKSCKCLTRELTAQKNHKHGHASRTEQSRTYRAWENAKARCHIPSQTNYADYGGRGISVCERWRNSFEMFLADMGECPHRLTLERIDPNGDYEPVNCRWATTKEQRRNKRTTVFIAPGITIGQAAEALGVSYNLVYRWCRLNGLTIDKLPQMVRQYFERKEKFQGKDPVRDYYSDESRFQSLLAQVVEADQVEAT